MRVENELREQLVALVEGEGLQLVAVEVVGTGASTVLRLVIDGPDGVNLDQCASISRQASAMLDVEDPFTHRYTLEVSSPGLDRKLYSHEDFARFVGRQIRVRMKPSYRKHRAVVGELLGLDGDLVRLRIDSETEVVELPLAELFEARLEVDWKKILNEGKHRR